MGCCFSEPIDFEGEVNLYHFDLHRAVGKGAFGKVRVVEHKQTKKLYALKYVDKAKCIRQKAVANVIQERRLLEEIDHVFIVNMRYAFQDDENCFFVLDLMLGGDLRFYLQHRGQIQEDVLRFWVAELACGLDYLHQKRIIHRDLKPDNILISEAGHAHLTDFNVAIHYSERRLHTSVAGSMAYMAPEVIGRKGYTWYIDWWSLGVTAYELLFQKRPFDGRTTEKMTNSITKDLLTFPDDALSKCSPDGMNFLTSLMDRNTNTRLGCRSLRDSLDAIRQHPWFKDINWDILETKEARPPYVPDLKQANFDVTFELDEFLMVEKPLTHTKRKANADLDKLKPELRHLEEHFTVYDFTRTKRMSYYPHNQPIVAALPAGSEADPTIVAPSRKGSLVPIATLPDRSQTGSPVEGQPSQLRHSMIPP